MVGTLFRRCHTIFEHLYYAVDDDNIIVTYSILAKCDADWFPPSYFGAMSFTSKGQIGS